jgi:hypothetical protein
MLLLLLLLLLVMMMMMLMMVGMWYHSIVQRSHEKLIVLNVGVGSFGEEKLHEITASVLHCFEERGLSSSVCRIDFDSAMCE